MNVGSRAVPSELYSPNSEATVGYVQTGSPQPSGFAMNVGVCSSHFDCIADPIAALLLRALSFGSRGKYVLSM